MGCGNYDYCATDSGGWVVPALAVLFWGGLVGFVAVRYWLARRRNPEPQPPPPTRTNGVVQRDATDLTDRYLRLTGFDRRDGSDDEA